MMSYPTITINELPKFSFKSFNEVPSEHPIKQFIEDIFPCVRQVVKFYYYYGVNRWNETEEFYDHLSTDRINCMYHGKNEDNVRCRLHGTRYIDDDFWFCISITEVPHIQFVDHWGHPILSFDIDLTHKAPIYNHQSCFCRWLPIKNIPATYLTHDVWTYCQHVLQEVRTHLPEQQLPEPNIENVTVSITYEFQSVMHLYDNDAPYIIEMTNVCGDSLVVHVYDPTLSDLPLNERVITWFSVSRPFK
jgi:hypothetical protein